MSGADSNATSSSPAVIWRLVSVDAGFKSDCASRAASFLARAAESQPGLRLTASEVAQRAKLAAKQSRHTQEEHSMTRWLVSVEEPPAARVAASPATSEIFDAEDAVLSAMRARRNAELWPWLVAHGLRPVDLVTVEPRAASTRFRALCGELFLRLATLPPAASDPAAESTAALLPRPVFTWFFSAVCAAVYPGSLNAARSLAEEEFRLSWATGPPLLAAALSRREPGPDGVTPLKKLRRPKKEPAPDTTTGADSSEGAASGSDGLPAADYTHFMAMLAVTLEPALHAVPSRAPRLSADALLSELADAIEHHVMPECMSDEALRRRAAAAASSGSDGGPAPRDEASAPVRRAIRVASASAAVFGSPAAVGSGVSSGATSTLARHATTGSILPLISRPVAVSATLPGESVGITRSGAAGTTSGLAGANALLLRRQSFQNNNSASGVGAEASFSSAGAAVAPSVMSKSSGLLPRLGVSNALVSAANGKVRGGAAAVPHAAHES